MSKTILSKSGVKREVETTYGVFNRNTGEQHKPTRRGATKYEYPSLYAAEQAIADMPAKWRSAYVARPMIDSAKMRRMVKRAKARAESK